MAKGVYQKVSNSDDQSVLTAAGKIWSEKKNIERDIDQWNNYNTMFQESKKLAEMDDEKYSFTKRIIHE